MAFRALLFCPNDKTARTVTQVLSELEFNVEACSEPFAAVKKLMSGHFDALVVDCDQEQNATLLFKSARNSTSNQTSLAVAIVEGQAGVAKAFRIGANLVLTKPINVEQSKGTLRVARGLLRKGEPGKPATAAALAAPRPVAHVLPSKPAAPAASAPVVAQRPAPALLIPPPENFAAAQAAASSGLADADNILDIKRAGFSTIPSVPLPSPAAPMVPRVRPGVRQPFVGAPEGPAGGFAGAASAPAPAREAQVHAPAPASTRSPHRAEDLFERPAEYSHISPITAASDHIPAPSFTFGGGEESSGAGKKVLLGVAASALGGVILYVGWSHFQSAASRPVTQAPATISTAPSTTPISLHPTPAKPVDTQPVPSAQPTNLLSAATSRSADPADDAESATDESAPSDSRASAKPTASVPSVSKTASPGNPAEAPLVVKRGAAPTVKEQATVPEAPDPNLTNIAATGSGGALSDLVSRAETAPRPVLQTVNVSQGVSQGLLLKKVQPVYPRSALSMHIEGIVELMATISKSGDIATVKVLRGDKQLTQAAVDAVKQWKYKPYRLNGEPVEIQTQVTISFKLPR